MSKKEKPFHLSIVDQLKRAEERLSKHKNIGMFVSRFVTEVETIKNTIVSTEILKEKLPEVILNLESFYQDFEEKYQRNEDACGAKRERTFIDMYFSEMISNLKKRAA